MMITALRFEFLLQDLEIVTDMFVVEGLPPESEGNEFSEWIWKNIYTHCPGSENIKEILSFETCSARINPDQDQNIDTPYFDIPLTDISWN